MNDRRGSNVAVRILAASVAAVFVLSSAGGFALAQEQTAPAQQQKMPEQQVPAEKHHSKLKGAVIGGAGGAVVGGKKGAAVGAGAGALWQHHKNKKAEKEAQKAQ